MGLSVADLTCFRGGRRVLHGLCFSVSDGETLVLRGPNGAGKSTLLRALAGLLPAGGTIALDGVPAGRDARVEQVAYVGHLDAVKSQLTVAENLAFWAAVLGGGGVDAALAAFHLAAIADRPAHLCSTGQKRRLGLARLILAPRRLWLLDEPMTSLDAASEAGLIRAMCAHCAGGGITVVAAHGPVELTPARELVLSAEAVAVAGAAADPFLAGTWA